MAPLNPLVQPLLTDLYQITMVYAYWRSGTHLRHSIFDLFFRNNPFEGEYSIFAGLHEALAFLESYRFNQEEIAYLQSVPALRGCEPEFWRWLATLDTSKLTVYAVQEGTPVFPRVPLLRVEGPMAAAQLVETTLLNLINFSTLIATNAARIRYAAGDEAVLAEFGLRRAQGPDGAMTATRAAIIGGFDFTSNVLAGKLFDLQLTGTHAHAFVQSFSDIDPDLMQIRDAGGQLRDISGLLEETRPLDGREGNRGELAAFLAYARAFPDATLLLVDTYDTLESGIPNALRVFRILRELGHTPLGIRLDSGDLAYLSREARRMFHEAGMPDLKIVASNQIDEQVLLALKAHEAEIDVYGIGTNLVTAEKDPALGGVYKLVAVDGEPRIKLTQDATKIPLPGRKFAYRLVGAEGFDLADVMTLDDEAPPVVGEPFLCRHPFSPEKRVLIVPSAVVPLHEKVFEAGRSLMQPESLTAIRERSRQLQRGIRPDHRRALNPTPYKISLSEKLFDYMHKLIQQKLPVRLMK